MQTGKVRRCQLGGDDQRQQHKQKSESKTAGQDFSQNAKILELSFIKNNCGKINKTGCLPLVKIIHKESSSQFFILKRCYGLTEFKHFRFRRLVGIKNRFLFIHHP